MYSEEKIEGYHGGEQEMVEILLSKVNESSSTVKMKKVCRNSEGSSQIQFSADEKHAQYTLIIAPR